MMKYIFLLFSIPAFGSDLTCLTLLGYTGDVEAHRLVEAIDRKLASAPAEVQAQLAQLVPGLLNLRQSESVEHLVRSTPQWRSLYEQLMVELDSTELAKILVRDLSDPRSLTLTYKPVAERVHLLLSAVLQNAPTAAGEVLATLSEDNLFHYNVDSSGHIFSSPFGLIAFPMFPELAPLSQTLVDKVLARPGFKKTSLNHELIVQLSHGHADRVLKLIAWGADAATLGHKDAFADFMTEISRARDGRPLTTAEREVIGQATEYMKR